MIARKVLILALLVVLVGLQSRLWLGEGSFAHVNTLQAKVSRKVAENSVKVQRNKILRAEIIELKRGLESIEEKARSEFGLIKEGETFFLLIEDDGSLKRAHVNVVAGADLPKVDMFGGLIDSVGYPL